MKESQNVYDCLIVPLAEAFGANKSEFNKIIVDKTASYSRKVLQDAANHLIENFTRKPSISDIVATCKKNETHLERQANAKFFWEERTDRIMEYTRKTADDRLKNTKAGQIATAEGWGFSYWQFLFDCAFIEAQIRENRQAIADYHQTMSPDEFSNVIRRAKQGQQILASKEWVDRQRRNAKLRSEKNGNIPLDSFV